MKYERKQIGPFRLMAWEYKQQTKAEKLALEWVLGHAHEFTVLELDWFLGCLKDHMDSHYLYGVKETIKIEKCIGATVMYSGAVDHYMISVSNKRTKSGRFCVSEPIGTDLNRHKIYAEMYQIFDGIS